MQFSLYKYFCCLKQGCFFRKNYISSESIEMSETIQSGENNIAYQQSIENIQEAATISKAVDRDADKSYKDIKVEQCVQENLYDQEQADAMYRYQFFMGNRIIVKVPQNQKLLCATKKDTDLLPIDKSLTKNSSESKNSESESFYNTTDRDLQTKEPQKLKKKLIETQQKTSAKDSLLLEEIDIDDTSNVLQTNTLQKEKSLEKYKKPQNNSLRQMIKKLRKETVIYQDKQIFMSELAEAQVKDECNSYEEKDCVRYFSVSQFTSLPNMLYYIYSHICSEISMCFDELLENKDFSFNNLCFKRKDSKKKLYIGEILDLPNLFKENTKYKPYICFYFYDAGYDISNSSTAILQVIIKQIKYCDKQKISKYTKYFYEGSVDEILQKFTEYKNFLDYNSNNLNSLMKKEFLNIEQKNQSQANTYINQIQQSLSNFLSSVKNVSAIKSYFY